MTEVELAWAAGFFEGEGTTTNIGGRFAVQIKNTDLEPLQRFQRAVETGELYGPYWYGDRPHSNGQKRPFWIWVLTAVTRALSFARSRCGSVSVA